MTKVMPPGVVGRREGGVFTPSRRFTERGRDTRAGCWPLLPLGPSNQEKAVKIAKCFPGRANFETKGLFAFKFACLRTLLGSKFLQKCIQVWIFLNHLFCLALCEIFFSEASGLSLFFWKILRPYFLSTDPPGSSLLSTSRLHWINIGASRLTLHVP